MDIPTCNYNLDNQEYYVNGNKNNEYVPYVYGFIISIASIGLLTSIYHTNLEYTNKLKSKLKLSFFIILALIFLGLLGYSAYVIGKFNTKNLSTTYSNSEILRPCYSKYNKKIYGLTDDVLSSNLKADRKMNISEEMSDQDLIIRYVSLDGQYFSDYNAPSNDNELQTYSSNSPNLKTSTEINNQNPMSEKQQTISNPYNTRTSNTSNDICGNATPDTASVDAKGTSSSELGSTVETTNNSAKPVETIKTSNTSDKTQNEAGTTNNDVTNNTTLQTGGSIRATG